MMTGNDESRVSQANAVVTLQAELSTWFVEHALPLWDEQGIDREKGGFFESLGRGDSTATLEAQGEVRRGRVVSRQIYVFDVGRRLGWKSRGTSPVQHGCDFLFSRLYQGDGRWHTSVSAASWAPDSSFSLYEQAFYLFAMARAYPSMASRYPLADTAAHCLNYLRSAFGRAKGGFEESLPPSAPLKSNPHMHLLEAALAWIEVSNAASAAPWILLAQELVDLCLTRFRGPPGGAVREYFDRSWLPAAGDAGRIVEPGHQFEWAWLLLEWAALGHCNAYDRETCIEAAAELVESAERWGVDPVRGVAINENWDDMSVKDPAAKLWPQTERVKAWCARLAVARTGGERDRACRQIAAAARGMLKYLRSDVPGLWHEVYAAEGHFIPGASRASSLYHLVCAIDVLRGTVQQHLADASHLK